MPCATENEMAIEAWRALLRAHATATDRIEAMLAEASLPSLAWYDVLWTIYRSPDKQLRHFELADEMVMSRSGLSRMIDRIQAAGLIERRSCPSDRRGQHLAVTEAGQEMLRKMWPVYEAGITEHFATLVGDDAGVVGEALRRVEDACRARAPKCAEAASATH